MSVEPFYENILRLHKAAKIEKLCSKIIMIQNALSNKRNEIKLLTSNPSNLGGQNLMENRGKTFEKKENNTHLVETILLDDIVDILPKNKYNKSYSKALLKIDIEGFEPFAFQHAIKLFHNIDIPIIFMEWGNFKTMSNFRNEIEKMIDFLLYYGLKPYMIHNYGTGTMLERKNWHMWPTNVHWKKDGF